RVPIEKVLFPPRDNTKALEEFAAGMRSPTSPGKAPPQQKMTTTITTEREEAEATVPGTAIEVPAGQTLRKRNAQVIRRLAKECYKTELDLANGLLTNGKPCDCLNDKHALFFESICEELIPLDPQNPIYREILGWVKAALPKATPEAISSGRYDAEYPLMASQMRDFRKRLTGSTSRLAMTEPKKQSTKGNCPNCGGPLDKDGCCPKCQICPLPQLPK
ncbi:unnamed protein product, partial [marine sediment metagenome]